MYLFIYSYLHTPTFKCSRACLRSYNRFTDTNTALDWNTRGSTMRVPNAGCTYSIGLTPWCVQWPNACSASSFYTTTIPCIYHERATPDFHRHFVVRLSNTHEGGAAFCDRGLSPATQQAEVGRTTLLLVLACRRFPKSQTSP